MTKQHEDLTVEIHLTVRVPKEIVNRVLAAAEEMGCGYGDPGKKELTRRLIIDSGIESIRDIDPTFNSYEVHQVK